ncbi:hypothetical protein Angca_005200 [Angiostrongylus cantonensis]|nr:hypothetical protein Angca_005200 [Angiostrongylus cantonensis]
MSTRQQRGAERCRCCPYGFHIDIDFVSYAEDVRKGGQNRTPTTTRKHGGDRTLLSPLDSIFSDSLENILSDFDDALSGNHGIKTSRTLSRGGNLVISSRLQNGYSSDYTGYNSPTGVVGSEYRSDPTTRLTLRSFLPDCGAPSKPPHRSIMNGPSTTSKQTNSAYTALGRTITEIKARNTESPFLEREPNSRIGSRVGTPIDLGVPSYNGSASLSRPRTPYRSDIEREPKMSFPESTLERTLLQSTKSGGNWRRPITEDKPLIPSNGHLGNFASLQRGRPYAVSDPEMPHRIRYYSASPNMPKKLQTVPTLLSASQFTYTHHNGNTVLARTQGTSMSPHPEDEKNRLCKEVISVGVCTAPLPPVKPCTECSPLRKEVQELLKRLAIAEEQPSVLSMGTITDKLETVERAVGETTQCYSIGTEMQICMTVDCGVDAPRQVEWQCKECQTTTVVTNVGVTIQPNVADVGLQTDRHAQSVTHFGVNTEDVEAVDQATMTPCKYYQNTRCQTESPNELEAREVSMQTELAAEVMSKDVECQTETDTNSNVESIAFDDIIDDDTTTCPRCKQREETFTRNVGVGVCSVVDKVCIVCDKATSEDVDENDAPGFKVEKDETRSHEFNKARAAAVKKLLMSEQKQPFVRGTAVSKSARFERNKGDDLEYIAEKNKVCSNFRSTLPATTPSGESTDALKSKVVLKKECPLPSSNVPDPVPARIPRPKISKFALPTENAETPDEAEEIADRLTPLRSELRSLERWPRSNTQTPPYSSYKTESESDEDSDDSEGCYDTHEDGLDHDDSPYEISTPMREAMESLNSHLIQPGSITPETADWAFKYVQHEWLKCAARKNSQFEAVDILIEQLKELSEALLKVVVNITDQNGNTALHYAVSHGNFLVVSSLLDSGECQLNLANRAGYSAVMLAALCSLENDVEKVVVQRLFELGDVNARAAQHGQTALMLSVSHGKKNTTELLLACGADVNLQDEEGSTALMCAAEHGHKEIVKLLLSQPGIDAALTDCDSSTALSIAVENGHRDIGVLIYAHLNYNRADSIEEAKVHS